MIWCFLHGGLNHLLLWTKADRHFITVKPPRRRRKIFPKTTLISSVFVSKGAANKGKSLILIILEPGEIWFNQMDPFFWSELAATVLADFQKNRISPSFEVCEEVDSIITSFTSWSLPWTMEGMFFWGSQSIGCWNLDMFPLHLRESRFETSMWCLLKPKTSDFVQKVGWIWRSWTNGSTTTRLWRSLWQLWYCGSWLGFG